MLDLVALDMAAGPGFVDALLRAWDEGDAVLPVDQRLPPAAKEKLIEAMGATRIHDRSGVTARAGRPVESGDALVVATSGTTGHPKGVVLSHEAVAASAELTGAALGVDPAIDTWLACLPLAHIGGLAVVTRALHSGTGLVVHERFEPARCEQAARDGATLVSLVVTAMQRIDASLFRMVLVGGSAIPDERPANSVATYGMTETGSGIVYDGWPLPGVELAVVGDELRVRSPTLLRCYRDGTVPLDAGGWFATGDAASIAPDGRLTVRGRIGDVIVTGGEKVWPVVVERVLRRLRWVDDVAVVGRPDAEWGERVTAVVTLAPGAAAPPIEEVRDQLSDELPRYALPRSLEVVEAFPRTAIGKIERRAL